LAEQFTDGSVKRHFDAAVFKIKAVLRSTDKEYVDSLTEHIEILTRYSPDSDSPQQHLSLLQQAVVHKKIVQITYRSNMKEEVTKRRVEAIGLLHYGSAWHLIGWCHLRNDYRDFRLTRMLGVILEDTVFDPSAHPSIQKYIEQLRAGEGLMEAVILFDKRIAKYVGEQKYLNGFVSEEDQGDCLRMKFLTVNYGYLARWLLMYTDAIRVEDPEELKTELKGLVQKLSAHHQSY
jgi:predicted DNA-binding transcriptional regulator YafY